MAKSCCGGGFSSTSISETVSGRHLPERRYYGTPHRHESIMRQRAEGLHIGVLRHRGLVPVADELAAHQFVVAQRPHRPKTSTFVPVQ